MGKDYFFTLRVRCRSVINAGVADRLLKSQGASIRIISAFTMTVAPIHIEWTHKDTHARIEQCQKEREICCQTIRNNDVEPEAPSLVEEM